MNPAACDRTRPGKLIVGIGSPHGLDQVGWRVAEGLRNRLNDDWQIRLAAVPLDLLDWLEPLQELHLIDASVDLDAPDDWAPCQRLDWPHPWIAELPCRATHDFNLPRVLQLADSLHLLPPRVTLWVIPVGDDFGASPTEPLGWGPQAVAGLESADSDVGRRGDHAWGLEQRCQAAATVIGRELSPAGNRPTTQTAAGPPERQNHA